MIEAENLTMRFGQTTALEGVSFRLEPGEIAGLVGPNGAGKTTLLRILTTFLQPTSGRARVGGRDVAEEPLAVRRLTGYLPEAAPLYADMRVGEYLDFAARARGLSRPARAERARWVAERCGLAEVWRVPARELSLGYRQRVGLAQALIHDPEVLLLDEPTGGLDPLQVVGIRGLIQAVKAYESLTVDAAMQGSRRLAMQALMANPLVPSWDVARPLLERLLEANRPWLPWA